MTQHGETQAPADGGRLESDLREEPLHAPVRRQRLDLSSTAVERSDEGSPKPLVIRPLCDQGIQLCDQPAVAERRVRIDSVHHD